MKLKNFIEFVIIMFLWMILPLSLMVWIIVKLNVPLVVKCIIYIMVFIGGVVAIYLVLSELKKYKKGEKILKEVLPRKAVLFDILIYINESSTAVDEPNDYYIYFYPIIKDNKTNKLYIMPKKYDYGKYKFKYTYQRFISFHLNFQLKSDKGKDVNIGDSVTFYLNNEMNKCEINDNKVNFDRMKTTYDGKFENGGKILSGIYNVSSENFLDILKDTIICEGVIDFDE